GEERHLELVLKLIADVGLLGEPNAGKSTLLSVISAARPKIADYPFTTLEPHLGVVPLSDGRSLVIADIPGIIAGAHAGKGLGLRFLQHVERTRMLAVLVPVDSPDPQATYELLRREAALYSADLAAKPHAVVLTKRDLLSPGSRLPSIQTHAGAPVVVISAVTGEGLPELSETLWQLLPVRVATSPVPTPAASPGRTSARSQRVGTGRASGLHRARAAARHRGHRAHGGPGGGRRVAGRLGKRLRRGLPRGQPAVVRAHDRARLSRHGAAAGRAPARPHVSPPQPAHQRPGGRHRRRRGGRRLGRAHHRRLRARSGTGGARRPRADHQPDLARLQPADSAGRKAGA